MCYLAIFSNFRNREQKILPSDIEETNATHIENFMKFLGLKLPYNRLEIEKFINERRSISVKGLLSIQNNLKREKRNESSKKEESHEQSNDNEEEEEEKAKEKEKSVIKKEKRSIENKKNEKPSEIESV